MHRVKTAAQFVRAFCGKPLRCQRPWLGELERGQLGTVLESLRAYDTLPQTPHVELIAKLVQIERPAFT